MEIITTPSLESRDEADLLLVPFWKGKKHAEAAASAVSLYKLCAGVVDTRDFSGKEGEFVIIYVSGQPEKRFGLLGLGDQDAMTVEKLRRSYAQATKGCRAKKLSKLNIVLPDCKAIALDDLVKGIVEGLLLPNYAFTSLQKDALKKEPQVVLKGIKLIAAGKHELAVAQKCATICEAVNFARDLVNGNADDITPQYLSAVARGLEKTCDHVKTTVLNKKQIEKEKMGLLLAVNRGSFREPAFIIVEYKGNPKSKEKTVLVGKGITFDTGGLNLKPTGSMETMKCDMAGAAAVLGTIQAASNLGLKINITGVIASTENSIGSYSFKPGDVYTGYAGKSVEIGNTDAEGRLILADALAYTIDRLKPTRIIDLATLTGAIEITFGDEATGLMSNNDALADLLIQAGSVTGERLWRLPMYEEFRDSLKSDIADIKSTGGRGGSSIKAAIFLQEFVDKTPWAHLDIAGTAFLSDARRYNPKYGTGVGVRLLISFLEHL